MQYNFILIITVIFSHAFKFFYTDDSNNIKDDYKLFFFYNIFKIKNFFVFDNYVLIENTRKENISRD